MLYTYQARDQAGNIKQGEIDLPSEEKLAQWLYGQGFLLTKSSVKKKGGEFSLVKFLSNLGFISLMEKVLFTRYLEVMLKAGVSLVRALSILSHQTDNRRFKRIINSIHDAVEKGIAFSDALKKYPNVFSDLYINIIKTGEVSGKLIESLDQIATQLKKDWELRKKITGALTYPVVIVVAMIGIGIGMMIFVLPKLITIFEDFNTKLPLPTRILIATGKFFGDYAWLILGGGLILFFLFFKFMRSIRGKIVFHKLYLILPMVGKVVKKVNLARFIRNLSSLLASGMPILKVLEVISESLGNIYYRQAVYASIAEVRKGVALSEALMKNPKLFPPIVTQVIEVGEETGALDEILIRLAEFYEEDVDQTMKNVSTIIEPILMLTIGAAVGLMAVSIILPIYSMTNSL